MFFNKNKNKNTGVGKVLKSLLNGIVDASISSVEVGLLTSRIRKSAVSIHELVSTTASACEEMVGTVQGIATNASNATVTAERVGSEVGEAISVMEGINAKMSATAERMALLKNASEKIQHVVKTINEITDQTNLLALNASIEAARAGDAGRGFAVVADEVRKLATQSQNATSEISETISEIQSEVGHVFTAVNESQESVSSGSDKIQKLAVSSDEIKELMQNIAYSTQEQSEASQQISESIFSVSQEADDNEKQTSQIMSLLDDLVGVIESQRALLAEQNIDGKVEILAQADHALWKKKIVDFEMGRISLDPSDAGDHTTCRLGQWYYGEGEKKHGTEVAFKQIETPHKLVHDTARKAIELRVNDPRANIDNLVDDLEAASVDVVKCLKEVAK